MTEDEAKTKWCPLIRNMGDVNFGTNRTRRGSSETIDGHNRCIGSGCMAWRETDNAYDPGSVPPRYIPAGYCGLAGKS